MFIVHVHSLFSPSQALFNMADPDDKVEDKFAIHAAAREGRSTPLHCPHSPQLLLTTSSPVQAVESLLSVNSKLSSRRDADDRLPLHWATAYSHLPIIKLLSSARSFDPDVPDASGWTPLHIAASLPSNGGLEIIQFLLTKEADVKLQTNSGATALHFASSKQNLDIVKLLLQHDASARAKDRRGQLPLHRAAAVGSVPIVKLLLENKSPVNANDVDGMTALHHAISEGHGDVAVELLRAGAEGDRKDGEGRTAVQCAPDGKVVSFITGWAEREGVVMGE